MRFCPTCGIRLRIKLLKEENSTVSALACDKCGFYEKSGTEVSKVERDDHQAIKVIEEGADKNSALPTISIECPKCKNNKAGWWFIQTRSGDEPATQFYRCTKCSHTWRSYS